MKLFREINKLIPYVKSSLVWAVFLSILPTVVFFSCKKLDATAEYEVAEMANKLKADFFNTTNITDAEIKKLAADIEMQDSIFNFLPEFVNKNGMPKWDKVLYTTSEKLAQQTATSSAVASSNVGNGSSQGLFFIPLQAQNSNQIQSYITAYKHNDSLYTYRLYNKDSLNSINATTV
jgi:hypothetical protein